MTTRAKLLQLLRQQPRTITELAQHLKLARNAISVQLDRLTADGIVLKGEIRQSETAGKPAREYTIAPGTEDRGSSAYLPFVESLLKTLPNHLDQKHRKQLLENVGKHMAEQAGISKDGSLNARIKKAITVVNQLGATAEIIHEDNDIVIKNMACPLASAVRSEPCVCDAVAAFFTQATGAKTRAECHHGNNLVCRYIISKKAQREST